MLAPVLTVADLTEAELVGRITARLPPVPPWIVVGIGDDAAVVEPERNRLEVLTVDALIDGIHFDRAFTPPTAIGHRALAANLSDLAAMGAGPRLALLSLALPEALAVADFDAIVAGLAALAAQHGLHVAGGNLTRSPGPLMVDITVTGTVKRRRALLRTGARPGDELYVSGTVGAAAAGLRLLREVVSRQSSVASQQSSVNGHSHQSARTSIENLQQMPEDSRLTSDDQRLVTAYLFPEPRVRLGTMLAKNRAASACMDLSDGLADAVRQIASASGVGAIVEAGALPIDPAARRWFESRGADPVREAISGGDDYELLFAVRPRTRGRLAAAARHGGVPLTRIGTCTDGGAAILRSAANGAVTDDPLPRGYSHFR